MCATKCESTLPFFNVANCWSPSETLKFYFVCDFLQGCSSITIVFYEIFNVVKAMQSGMVIKLIPHQINYICSTMLTYLATKCLSKVLSFNNCVVVGEEVV